MSDRAGATTNKDLTADTITDEQIQAGYHAGLISYSLLEFATFPFGRGA